MSICGEWTLSGFDAGAWSLLRVYCRSWSCECCNPKRITRLKEEIASGNPSAMLTLTVNPARGQSPEARAYELVDAMREMIRRARKEHPTKRVEYFAVFEETKRGEPHLHLCIKAPFIRQRWISEQMLELIDAPVVDIRKCSSGRDAARYLAKYVGKGPKQFGNLKRYWSSRGYVPKHVKAFRAELKRPRVWVLIRDTLEDVVASLDGTQFDVSWLGANEVAVMPGTVCPRAPPGWCFSE